MSDEPLFRTNSYSGNPNPFHDIVDTLIHEPDQKMLLYFLDDNLDERSDDPDYIDSRILAILCGDDTEQKFQEFLARSEEYRRDFYSEAIKEISKQNNINLNCCCWFTRRNIVLSRKNGYGLKLHRENGVLRCYDTGLILLKKGFDILCAYDSQPKLSPDTITNNQLISEKQLSKLLDLEESYGKVLTDTCLKKDVLNLLKRADKGLLGNSFVPSFETQERRAAEERERIINDLL